MGKGYTRSPGLSEPIRWDKCLSQELLGRPRVLQIGNLSHFYSRQMSPPLGHLRPLKEDVKCPLRQDLTASAGVMSLCWTPALECKPCLCGFQYQQTLGKYLFNTFNSFPSPGSSPTGRLTLDLLQDRAFLNNCHPTTHLQVSGLSSKPRPWQRRKLRRRQRQRQVLGSGRWRRWVQRGQRGLRLEWDG